MIFVYDYEQAPNLHVGVFLCIKTLRFYVFEISERKNDIVAYKRFLRQNKGQIGFNNINYDSWLTDEIFTLPDHISALEANKILYKKSKSLIQTRKDNYYPLIPQRDVFRVHHFDNKNKAVSLKQYMAFIGWNNVMDINFDPDKPVDISQIDDIIFYCKNDVLATKDLYDNTQVQLKLRRILSKEYGFDMMNFNDPKIGEQIILHEYCQKTGKDKEYVSGLRTFRDYIDFKTCLQPNIKFKSEEFSKVYNIYHAHRRYIKTDKKFEFSQKFHNGEFHYGLGGLHQACTGVYKSDDKYCVLDIDVSGMYPSIEIEYGFYPAHLGPMFKGVARDIKNRRMRSKRLRKDKSLTEDEREYHNAISDGFKLALNGALFGKTNDMYSFLYDPFVSYSTTITGQMCLSMLIEQLSVIPNIFFIQSNTDGISILIERKHLPDVYKICKKWEKQTMLELEYAEFKQLYIRDVSSFIAESTEVYDDYFSKLKTDNSFYIKAKGAYEIDKKVGAQWAYHKNNSSRIIPLAVKEYFFKGIPVEQTIKNHKNIDDFLIWVKLKKDDKGSRWWIEAMRFEGNNLKTIKLIDKVVRYYMSTEGYVLKKKNTGDREQFLHVHPTHKKFNRFYKQTLANKKPHDFPDNIDYSYYIHEAKKLINAIDPIVKQTTLF